MTVIGIAGGSASGKSTLASHIIDGHDDIVHISLDDFYKNRDDQPHSFDDPSALKWEDAARSIEKFIERGYTEIPRYSFKQGRCVGYEAVSGDHCVVEGIWALYSRLRRDLIDVSVYIETPLYERVKRRVLRDTTERGVSIEEAFEYFDQALEKERENVVFQRDCADFIVDGRPTETDGENLRRVL